jgi:putative membrane protein
MQIIRTILWVLLFVVMALFAVNNWKPVEVKIWEGLVLETKVPALVIVAFLLGLLPMWMIHRGRSWQLNRRIRSLQNAAQSAAAVLMPPPPVEPEPVAAPIIANSEAATENKPETL